MQQKGITDVMKLFPELACERSNRAKAEKNRSLLSRDLEDLGTRCEFFSYLLHKL